MPQTRKIKSESVDVPEIESESTDKKIEFVAKDASQWIFLLNDEVLQHDPNIDNKPIICPLRHPKTGGKAMFLLSNENHDVYEVTQFKENYRSWFIGETVQHDGSLYMTTIIDPIFLVLPYLIKTQQTDKYMMLDQIVIDDDYPECHRLVTTRGLSELYHVADSKGADDYVAYKYNKDKTLSWLKLKTERLGRALERQNISVTARSVEFITNKNTSEEYLRYAYGIVSDYLPVDLGNTLREHLGIPVLAEKRATDSPNPPSKRVKVEEGQEPTDDYSKDVKKENKTKAKLSTIKQKQLEKTDKSGMKSMMSFFSPKTK